MNTEARCITSVVHVTSTKIGLAYKISGLVVCVNRVAWDGSQIHGQDYCFSPTLKGPHA